MKGRNPCQAGDAAPGLSPAVPVMVRIGSLGYLVGGRHAGGAVEFWAQREHPPHERFVVRHYDGSGHAEDYVAACTLAMMLGIDLEDG